MNETQRIHDDVRARYAEAALSVARSLGPTERGPPGESSC